MILEKIHQLIDENSEVYVLTNDQLQRLEHSRKQIDLEIFLTQEKIDHKVEKWLTEK